MWEASLLKLDGIYRGCNISKNTFHHYIVHQTIQHALEHPRYHIGSILNLGFTKGGNYVRMLGIACHGDEKVWLPMFTNASHRFLITLVHVSGPSIKSGRQYDLSPNSSVRIPVGCVDLIPQLSKRFTPHVFVILSQEVQSLRVDFCKCHATILLK